MKINKIFLVTIFILSCCHYKNSTKIIVQASISQKISASSIQMNNGNFYKIKMELFNNTDSVLEFWIMNCSWQLNWIFDNDKCKLFVECFSNFPELKQIQPYESIVYNGIIEIGDTANINKISLRTGFVLITKAEVSEDANFMKLLRNKISTGTDIFWSKPFKMNFQ
jgi:hypothetical protein